MLVTLVVALILITGSANAAAPAGGGGSYDSYCNQIVTFAKKAAGEYNKGNVAGAEASIAKADKAFEDAVAIDPENPQAYLFMGTFKTNTHKYDESIEYFQKALSMIPESDKQNRFRIEKSIHSAYYKKYSMLRDRAYDNGNGNVTLAYEYGKLQLQYSPAPHRTHHELATLGAMLCEYDDDTNAMCHQSHVYYRIATYSTLQHYNVARSHSLKEAAKMACMRSDIFLGVWDVEKYNKKDGRLKVDEPVEGLYINKLKGEYNIQGPDGLITSEDQTLGDCSVFIQSEDHYFNVAANLFPEVKPKYPPGELDPDESVFSLAQFAGSTFYHWMVEGIPKLIAFRFFDPDAHKTRILVPAAPSKDGKTIFPSFITESLKMLRIDENSIIPYMGTGMRGEDGARITTVTWKAQSCPGETMAEDYLARRMCAALPHPKPLKMARDALSVAASVTEAPRAPPKYILIARRGDDVTSRQFNETALIEQLVEALPEAGYFTYKIVEFYANKHSLAGALNLFRKATVVVGAHGGALSNLIVSPIGTGVVEIGFQSVSARHYEHMSAVLGLNYRRVRVTEDPLQRALGAPTIEVDFDAVIKATLELLPPPSEEDNAIKANPDLQKGARTFSKESMEEFNKAPGYESMKESPNKNGPSTDQAEELLSEDEEAYEDEEL